MDSYKLRFIPLGGILGVTKNMYVYELYRDDRLQDIIIVDCGIGFPQDKALGVDFVIPDISYLKDKTDKIRAVLISHGHEDHISALPYHYKTLGRPPIYTATLTASFLTHKFEEIKEKVPVNIIDYTKEYSFGGFRIEFINMTHSIPDTMHILIKTPVGNIYHGTDYKLDLTPPYGNAPDFYKITKAGHDGLLCLMSDCLGSDREGLTLSESAVGQTFEHEMRRTKGKLIMSTFSSNISRIRQCVETAIVFNRKVAFLGRSMRENARIAQEIGYLPMPEGTLIKEEDIMKQPPNKVCIIATGSQGQYNSALARLATNKNKNVKIKPGDKVMFSSDPVPGNEGEVFDLIEELILMGAQVVYSDMSDNLHASGHGNQEDIKFLMRFASPKYFIPIGGTVRHQRSYQALADQLGFKKDTVFLLKEGETVVFEKNAARRGDPVETRTIYVDAYGVGDVGNAVLRDRQTIATDGMMVVLLVVDSRGVPIQPPRFISRGFVFEKNEEQLFAQAADRLQKLMGPQQGPVNINNLKREVGDAMEDFFFGKKGRNPLIVVDVVQM